jgi:transcription elongation factor GreA
MQKQKRNVITIGDGTPLHLTAEGLKQLKEKRDRITRNMPALIEETQRTAAYGDRSDNAEYKAAKGALRHANIQLMTIEEQLTRAVVIPEGKNATGVVRLGSTVTVESENGTRNTFQILGSHETNPGAGKISNQSPLGAAFIGKRVGDVVNVKLASGMQEYKVVKVG